MILNNLKGQLTVSSTGNIYCASCENNEELTYSLTEFDNLRKVGVNNFLMITDLDTSSFDIDKDVTIASINDPDLIDIYSKAFHQVVSDHLDLEGTKELVRKLHYSFHRIKTKNLKHPQYNYTEAFEKLNPIIKSTFDEIELLSTSLKADNDHIEFEVTLFLGDHDNVQCDVTVYVQYDFKNKRFLYTDTATNHIPVKDPLHLFFIPRDFLEGLEKIKSVEHELLQHFNAVKF